MLKVPSLFESEVCRRVKDMEHHIVVYEEIVEKGRIERREERGGDKTKGESSTIQKIDASKDCYERKRKVATPISLEDLFKPRSFEAGVGKSDVRRVLLYGNPGSGKTCISKAIAHKWAIGEILQELEAVYVIPIRRLNLAKAKGARGEAIEEVVAQMCFKQKGSNVDFEKLKTQINDDLDMSSTLLVFDGLDEADDDARKMVSEAGKGKCKTLILTRPYNLRGLLTKVDIQFECLGFNDQQLENYINKELQPNEASRLIHSLQQDLGMWETAHTPVTAHILCSLSKQHGTSIENRGRRASMFQIYGDITNYAWERFKERPEARMVNKDTVFGDLEKIAFEALRSGQILIEERIVKSHATSTNTTGVFKESGFLLFVLEGQQYKFPHLTFQEYFAGRFIANSLKNKGSDEERRVLKFIREGKYSQKNALALSFAMHALAQKQSKLALQEILTLVDEKPIEVLGIQHFFLRMRVFDATLEEADEDDLKDLLDDKKAIELAKGAHKLLKRTVDHVLIREIVVKEFRQFYRVLEEFPQVLKGTVDEVKKMLTHSQKLAWMEMAKITDVLKLARLSTKYSNEMTQVVLDLANQVDIYCDPMECIRRFEAISANVPQHADEILSKLKSWCSDKRRSSVRQAAMEAIGRFVAAAPQHAGEILPTLVMGCGDDDSGVHRAAIEATVRVVAAAPQHAGDILLTLEKVCGDEDSDVRLAATEAIGPIVAASPQHTGEVLLTLANEYGDDDSGVRPTAIEAIGRVVAAVPQHAGEVLFTLATWCYDEDSDVRLAATEAIGRVVAAAPQHAGDILLTLEKVCGDEDSDVRLAATEAIGRVVAAAPQHAGDILLTLEKVCGDEDSDVRLAATEAIGRVVAAAPQHAGDILLTLEKVCGDEDSDIRLAATEAIGRVVAAAPQHAGDILLTLEKVCGDDDSDARPAAIEAIGHIVVAAPQHICEFLPILCQGVRRQRLALPSSGDGGHRTCRHDDTATCRRDPADVGDGVRRR